MVSRAEMAHGSDQDPVGFHNPGGVWILHPQELEHGRGKASASAEPELREGTVVPQGQRE